MFWSITDCVHDGVLCLAFIIAAVVVLTGTLYVVLAVQELSM